MARSELTIAYPDISFNAVNIASNTTNVIPGNDTYRNLFYGSCAAYYERLVVGTQTNIGFDMLTARRIDFICLRGLNLMTQQDEGNIRVRVWGSNTSILANTALLFDINNLSTTDLINGTDLFSYLTTPSDNFRYFNFSISSTASFRHRLRKFYLGTLYDFGRSPSNPYNYSLISNNKGFSSSAPSLYKSSYRKRNREFNFTFKAIEDTKRNDFDTKVGQYLDSFPVCLVHKTDGINSPLGGSQLSWGWLDYDIQSGIVKDLNTLQMSFVEDLA